MSRVRYVNKKTGWVSIYESTPSYDPDLKQSRPKRTYIGYEDPVTREFVPSSHKPGRKKNSEKSIPSSSGASLPEQEKKTQEASAIESKNLEIAELTSQVDKLNEEVRSLKSQLKVMKKAVDKCVDTLNKAQSSI